MSFLFGQIKERQYRNRYLSLSSEDSDWVLSSQIPDKRCLCFAFFFQKQNKESKNIFALKIKGCFGAVELTVSTII